MSFSFVFNGIEVASELLYVICAVRVVGLKVLRGPREDA
jgi:hypothetical protein